MTRKTTATARLELRLTATERAQAERRAARAGVTMTDLAKAGLLGEDTDRAAWLAGYRAALRDVAARVETLASDAPE